MKHFSSLFLPATGFNTAKFSVRWALILLLLVVPLLGWGQYPSISNFSPTSGSTGTSVVITGSGFTSTGTIAVRFPDAWGHIVDASNFVVNSANQITVQVPVGALSGPITVLNAGNFAATSVTSFVTDNYLIGTGDLTVCSGKIYDDGGATSNPTWQREFSTTISPATAGSKVKLYFSQFDIDPVDAILFIYDGPDFNAPLIGQYAGNNGPGVVAATNPTGQLTIRYASSGGLYSESRPGFEASISCVAGVPNISSFTPTNGTAGTSVVITGVNFSGTTAVRFNGTAAASFVVNSSTQITVPVPAGATSGPITVTNGNGTGSGSVFTTDNTLVGVSPITTCSGSIYDSQANYYYGTVSSPRLQTRTTTIGPATAGGKVRLTFTQFNASLGDNAYYGPGYVEIYDGPNTNAPLLGKYTGTTSPGTVTATNPAGQLTLKLSRYLPASPPVAPIFAATISCFLGVPNITSFTPASGEAGTSVVLTGLNFLGTTAVRFNGVLAPGFIVDSDTQIRVPVPAGSVTGRITVTNGIGTGSSFTNFTLAPPLISSFTPTNGVAGTSVVITGSFFANITAVRFNGVLAPGFIVNSSTQITVSVPVEATNGPISVTGALGTGTSATSFILAPPVISSFTPANGLVGASVVITGTSFLQASAVRFNGLAASGFVVNSSTQITVSVPAGATSGPISVTTPSGTGTSASSFTVLAPTISSFTPTSGLTGTSVVITGTNFTGTTAVRFNGTAATGYSVNADGTQITVNVPTNATSGLISVTTPTGTATSTTNFTVPEPTISSFSPTSGTSGTSVVITGTNFTGTTAVRFNGTAATGFVVNSDTQLTVNVPTGASTGPLTVTTGATATSATSFVTDNYWLSPTALTVCSGTLYDANGPNNVTAQDNTTTLSPATDGAMVRLTFTQFRLDTSTGTLYIYDGPSANAPLLGQYSAVANPGIVTATNATGQLTLRLVSGTPTTGQLGFAATISCVVGVPIISSFTPSSGGQSVSVTITGTNFIGTTAVRFNGALASGFVVDSDTQITVPVPAGATSGPIAVTNGIGTGTSASSFAVLAPAISSFTPTSGGQNVSVTITGTNFTGTTAVRFNGALASGFVVDSDTQITTSVSTGAISGPIAVTNGVGTGTSASSFTVLAPTISSFTPSSGTGGTSVVITGANFTGITAVAFNGTAAASFVVDSDTQITASVSAGTISGFVTVTNGVGTGTSASNFVTGDSQVPLLTSVSPARNLPTASLGANVVLTFSQPIAASTAGNVRVFGSQRGGQLVRSGNATASGNTITVDPARPFAPGERVMVTVPATVQSTAGYSTLARVHEFTAETAPAPATFLDPATSYAMQAQSRSVTVGDLNGDGLLDVVTGDFYGGTTYYGGPPPSGSVVVRLGLGNGQLGPPVETSYADYPTALTLGDVDGDGDLDLLTSGATDSYGNAQNHVYTRLNNGSGSFGNPLSTQVNVRPTHTVLGDLDGDGDLDMLTAAGQATLSFNANGTFTQNANYIATRTTAGAFITAVDVALGDVDGDGDLDALIANNSIVNGINVNVVSVRLNNGLGVFSGTYNVPMGRAITKLVVGDVDGDGDLDLATSSSTTSTVSVRLNYGNGTFGGGADYTLAFAPNTLALGDVDGDGDLDLVTAGDSPTMSGAAVGQAVVRLNNGSGTFNVGSNVGTGGSKPFVALGDMDGDGTLDLLTSHEGNSKGNITGNIGDMAYDYAELFIRFNTALPATVAGFSPQSGPAGTLVTITGNNLSTVRGVRFGGSSELAPITSQTSNSLTVQVPIGATSGALTLTTAKGLTLSTSTPFTYTPSPAGLLAKLSTAGPLDVCAPRTLTATATSQVLATGPAGLNGNVFGIVTRPDGRQLLVGNFTTYNGATVNRILQLKPDGSRDTEFGTGLGFDGNVQSVALLANGKVVLGGDFTSYDGTPATRIIRLKTDGKPDDTFLTGSGFGAAVQSIVVQPNGQILVGGLFSSYNTTTGQNRLIRLNADGTRDPSLNTGTGFIGTGVNTLAVQADGKVLVGGSFSDYNGTSGRGGIIRLTTNGAYDASFATGAGLPGGVSTIAVQADGRVLVGGNFTIFDGLPQRRIVRLKSDGTLDPDFKVGAGFESQVNVVALQTDGNILVGGQFLTYNGTTGLNRIVRLSKDDGSLDTSFNTGTAGFDLAVRSMAVQPDGSVVVGGNFSLYQGVATGHLISLLPNGNPNSTPKVLSGASFTFAPGNTTTTGELVTSTAGTYSVVASLNGATSDPSSPLTLTACGAPAGPTLASLTPDNGGEGTSVVLTGTNLIGATDVTFNGTAATGFSVSPDGTTLTVSVPAGATSGNIVVTTPYGQASSTLFTVPVVVVPVAPTVVFNDVDKVFGEAGFDLAATSNSGSPFTYTLVSGTAATVTATGRVTITGAGTVTISATQPASGGYLAGQSTSTLTIAPKLVTITATAGQNKDYRAPEPVFAYTNSEGLPASAFSGTLGRAPGENVADGPFAYTLSTLAATPNYTLTLAPGGNFAIIPSRLTITAADQLKAYGQSLTFAGTEFTSTGLVAGETAGSVTLTSDGAAAPAAVGSYAIVPSAVAENGTFKASNYDISFVNGTLKVDKAVATISFTNTTPTYTGSPLAVTATTAPDNLAGVSVSYSSASYPSSTTPPSVAGTYSVSATLTNPNYSGSASGTLVIGKATATLALNAADLSQPYTESGKVVGATTTPAGLSGVSVSYAQSGAPVASPTTVGSYSVTATLTNDNFSASSVSGTLSIVQAPNTITFAALSNKTYGDADFMVSASASSNLPVSFAVSGKATLLPDGKTVHITGAGDVTVTASQAGNANYVVATPVPRTFTVNKADASNTITLANLTPTYTGSAQAAAASTTVGGMSSFVYVYKQGNTVVTSPTNAGSYAVTATLTNPNYSGSASGTLVISKAVATISFTNTAPAYTGLPLAVTAATTPANLEGVSVSYSSATYPSSTTAPSAVGSYSVSATLTNPNYQLATSPVRGTLVIGEATPTVTVADASVQYADKVTLTASVTAPTGQAEINSTGGVVTFKLVVGAVTQTLGKNTSSAIAGGVWTGSGSFVIPYAPGSYKISAEFVPNSVNFQKAINAAAGTLTVTAEDGVSATYTGALFASTSGTNVSMAVVTLSATIKDLGVDGYSGDIRNATVTFINRDNGTVIKQGVPVGLVTATDLTTGTATYNWATDIANANSQTYTIGVQVDGHYARNNSADNATVTVSKPLNDFVTGGGYMVLKASAGLKAGDAGSKNHFGFNIKYNKSGTNLQGNINTIIRRTEPDGLHVYQVKGNAMTSLSVQPATGTAPAKATFNGKASIQDITNPLVPPISVDGGASLQVTLTDNGDPGSKDLTGFTVWNKTGGLWFTSNWTGTKTEEQLLAAGNLVVRGGAYSATSTPPASKVIVATEAAPQLLFEAFPNPASYQTVIRFQLPTEGRVRLDIYNALGALVKTLYEGTASANVLQSTLLPTTELSSGVYLCRLSHGTQVEQLRLIIEK